jgi:hypothetical protein
VDTRNIPVPAHEPALVADCLDVDCALHCPVRPGASGAPG